MSSARIILLTPARRFIANQYGLGYQIPLGIVFIGGPLVDAGHAVKLIDNDLYGWSLIRLSREIAQFEPDYILLGHTGSTAAHTTCLETAVFLRQVFPGVKIAYGGVYPSYAANSILNDCTAIDAIVRGEAEQTVLELIEAWQNGGSLASIPGLATREHGLGHQRPPLLDLDAYRPGWELVDWPGYKLFGIGRSAIMQFSRGCPLTCTYCGQWLFWKKWRHRSTQNFVNELTILAKQYNVKIVCLADENFAADQAKTIDVLERLVSANLDLSLNVNMTAADVVRDEALLPLYKAAGIDCVVMGVESLEDHIIDKIRKNNPYHISIKAVTLLRQHHIISMVDIIYGLENETVTRLGRKFRKIVKLGPDILNAVYLTPHFWTKDGRDTDPNEVIQTDMAKWTYRNQIINTPHMSPTALFLGVKLTEALFHLRPKGLTRLFWINDARARQIYRASIAMGFRVVIAEIVEFLFDTRFSPKGRWQQLPGKSQ